MLFDLRGIHWVNIMRTTWQTVSRIVSKILDQLNIPFYSISVSGQQDHRHASRAFSCSATFTVGQWRHIEAESGGSCWVTSCVWKVKRRNCEAVHDSPTSLILSLWLREMCETSLTVTLTRKIARHASSNLILLQIPAKIDSRVH